MTRGLPDAMEVLIFIGLCVAAGFFLKIGWQIADAIAALLSLK